MWVIGICYFVEGYYLGFCPDTVITRPLKISYQGFVAHPEDLPRDDLLQNIRLIAISVLSLIVMAKHHIVTLN